ncbi:hypothetical protein JXB31_01780 [Candidatus Woesearchaeota archaeon]|nr:hypothetical protein [Candidatus Woesearchaeota archaeon]
MNVSDLQPKQGNVTVEVDVLSKSDVREFQKFGKPGKVCNAEASDSTGKIKLTLWNEQIDLVNPGDKVRIENGFVNEWQGELQLTTGRFGKIEIIGKADASPAADAKADPKEEISEADETDNASAVDDDVSEETVE